MPLSKEDAKLRAAALKHIGLAIALADGALRHAMYNRRSRALHSIALAGRQLNRAEELLYTWLTR